MVSLNFKMDFIRSLSDAKHVQKFQQFCGLEFHNNVCQNGTGHSLKHDRFVSNGGYKSDDVRKTRNGIKNGYVTRSNNANNHKIEKDINCNNRFVTSSNSYQIKYSQDVKQDVNITNSYHNSDSVDSHVETNNHTAKYGTSNNFHVSDSTKSFTKYRVKYALPYYAAVFGAFLGDELFYLTFYPFVVWNLDCVLGRKTIWIWTLVMFIGQATKDYLKVPRPRSPPVIQVETHHLNEFSLPSTHAMAGTAMPVVMAYLLLTRYEFPFWLAVGCVPVWTILTCMSRIYLGVHSILDVVCGVLYSLLIVAVTLPYMDNFDSFLQMHPIAPVILWTVGLAMCTVCYPAQGKNVAKGSGVRIVAIYLGYITGLWLNYQIGLATMPQTSLPYHIVAPSLKCVLLGALRFVVGALIVAVIKPVMEKITVTYFSYLANLEIPDKRHPAVETSYIITTYSVIGILLEFGVPIIFSYLRISRPAILDIY